MPSCTRINLRAIDFRNISGGNENKGLYIPTNLYTGIEVVLACPYTILHLQWFCYNMDLLFTDMNANCACEIHTGTPVLQMMLHCLI